MSDTERQTKIALLGKFVDLQEQNKKNTSRKEAPDADKNKTFVSAQMSERLASRLSEVAREKSITRSELVRKACELYLACDILEEFGAKVVQIQYKG